MTGALAMDRALPAPKPGVLCGPAGRRRRSLIAIERIVAHIEAHYAERLNLDDLAAMAELSVFRFVTVFRRQVGTSPHRFVCRVRVKAAQKLLMAGIAPAIVASEVGFFDQSHLCRHFKITCGMTPGQYLAGERTTPIEMALGVPD